MPTRRRTIMDYVSAELLLDPEEGLDEHEEILTTGRIDSMSVMRLVFFIKDEFSITIPNQDLVVDNFRSIDALDTYLSGHGHG
jgi:acyl carrier protein